MGNVIGQHTIEVRDSRWVVEHPMSCPLAEFGCAVSLAAEDLDGVPVPPGRYEVFVDDIDGRMWVGDVVLSGVS